ncbi:hypothetical protein PR048_013568 [Dryococelus australis]|uniref:Uncharacterized protein n=1 Tax=Dryococelus australis TaxID=614101 RepID=A0ABQ9HSJ4_9NEOP|nr:hypothetical protein PR048_013568 [Dryococelus australis]
MCTFEVSSKKKDLVNRCVLNFNKLLDNFDPFNGKKITLSEVFKHYSTHQLSITPIQIRPDGHPIFTCGNMADVTRSWWILHGDFPLSPPLHCATASPTSHLTMYIIHAGQDDSVPLGSLTASLLSSMFILLRGDNTLRFSCPLVYLFPSVVRYFIHALDPIVQAPAMYFKTLTLTVFGFPSLQLTTPLNQNPASHPFMHSNSKTPCHEARDT